MFQLIHALADSHVFYLLSRRHSSQDASCAIIGRRRPHSHLVLVAATCPRVLRCLLKVRHRLTPRSGYLLTYLAEANNQERYFVLSPTKRIITLTFTAPITTANTTIATSLWISTPRSTTISSSSTGWFYCSLTTCLLRYSTDRWLHIVRAGTAHTGSGATLPRSLYFA